MQVGGRDSNLCEKLKRAFHAKSAATRMVAVYQPKGGAATDACRGDRVTLPLNSKRPTTLMERGFQSKAGEMHATPRNARARQKTTNHVKTFENLLFEN